jgi:hypothetical protein
MLIRTALIAASLFSLFLQGSVAQMPASSPAPTATPIVLQAQAIPGLVNVVVPKDAMLVVKTTESLNSYSAHQGERIRYEVVQDFIVSGYLIAKAGDIAEGSVQEGQQGDSGGFYGIGWKAANLRVSVDRVFTFCGATIQLNFDRSEYRRRQGIFGAHKDVEIIKGQKYAPMVDHPQTACAVKTDEQAAPIGDDVLKADKG